MRETCDVVVLGLGGMGAAALYHLAKKRLRVVGVEQHVVPHALGSSHGSSRVIRKAYFEDARYVPILERSYALWKELEHESGAQLYTRTGCLNVGPRDHDDIRALVACVQEHALPHELLDARAIEQRFPAFRMRDDVLGVLEEDAGVLAPERCTAAHVARAVANGARVHAHERVVDVRVTSQGVEVRTDRRAIACGHVVVAAGPWLPSLANVPGVARIARLLRVTRQVQLWFAPGGATYAFGAFPVFIELGVPVASGGESTAAYYGMPPLHGDGVKVCRHGDGATTSPDAIDRTVHERDIEDVRAYLTASLPRLAEEPVTRSAVCMYTMTPDGHFAVGELDDGTSHGRVVLLGGFSGHGYKMACAMGEIVSELVVDGKSRLDIALFDPARLARA